MKTIHELYYAALAADNAWTEGLIKVFGKSRASDMRYRKAGTEMPLDLLHAEFQRANKEWRNHPDNWLTKD